MISSGSSSGSWFHWLKNGTGDVMTSCSQSCFLLNGTGHVGKRVVIIKLTVLHARKFRPRCKQGCKGLERSKGLCAETTRLMDLWQPVGVTMSV